MSDFLTTELGVGDSMADDDSERYLYTVQYDGEAERKRVEYLFNNWEDGDIDSPSGLAKIAENVDHEELYEQVATKVPEEQIGVYRLQSAAPEVESKTITVEQELTASLDAVEGFLDYMLSKKKAVLQSASRNEYEMYTKKGRAEVSYTLREEKDESVTVQIRVTGVPPAPSFLADFFETELSDYAASQ
jgi:hypothetical protein